LVAPGRIPPVYFYRDRDGCEIDLVFDVDGKLWPVEVRDAATVRREWAGAFAPLERLEGRSALERVICLTAERIPMERRGVVIQVTISRRTYLI
jgi:hypothetical protein